MRIARCWVVRLLYIREQGRKRNKTSQAVITLQSHSSSHTVMQLPLPLNCFLARLMSWLAKLEHG
jgi:hypothetical protein